MALFADLEKKTKVLFEYFLTEILTPAVIWALSHPELTIAISAGLFLVSAKAYAKIRSLRCPNCRSKHLRRSHRRNLLERFLSFVSIYPFRCDSCGLRFKTLR